MARSTLNPSAALFTSKPFTSYHRNIPRQPAAPWHPAIPHQSATRYRAGIPWPSAIPWQPAIHCLWVLETIYQSEVRSRLSKREYIMKHLNWINNALNDPPLESNNTPVRTLTPGDLERLGCHPITVNPVGHRGGADICSFPFGPCFFRPLSYTTFKEHPTEHPLSLSRISLAGCLIRPVIELEAPILDIEFGHHAHDQTVERTTKINSSGALIAERFFLTVALPYMFVATNSAAVRNAKAMHECVRAVMTLPRKNFPDADGSRPHGASLLDNALVRRIDVKAYMLGPDGDGTTRTINPATSLTETNSAYPWEVESVYCNPAVQHCTTTLLIGDDMSDNIIHIAELKAAVRVMLSRYHAFQDAIHVAVLVISYMGPKHGRIMQAHHDGKDLILQCSPLINFEDYDSGPVSLFARYTLACPTSYLEAHEPPKKEKKHINNIVGKGRRKQLGRS
ncbi:hypothetical protein BDW59DRAFT_160872 [Aspergillus cavernicola]|uniref:Uncharacterized protein n=1 Tax=Aspergillus cavernicola TaxID=176166 RepID=A0ABR4IFZ1_9EURO